ncbi:MAG: hypothetical protein LUG44_02545 [Clostridiales bacterium]|nr:hypothetical protein [Clostridiales bacterium]
MKTIFDLNDCFNIFLDPQKPTERSPVDGAQLMIMIQGMKAVGAVPIGYPPSAVTFFFADNKKAVAVEVGNERLQNENFGLNTGKPFYITASTHYAPLQKQGSTAAV